MQAILSAKELLPSCHGFNANVLDIHDYISVLNHDLWCIKILPIFKQHGKGVECSIHLISQQVGLLVPRTKPKLFSKDHLTWQSFYSRYF
jgi:hypothetical protein